MYSKKKYRINAINLELRASGNVTLNDLERSLRQDGFKRRYMDIAQFMHEKTFENPAWIVGFRPSVVSSSSGVLYNLSNIVKVNVGYVAPFRVTRLQSCFNRHMLVRHQH